MPDRNPAEEQTEIAPHWLVVEDEAHGVSLQDLLEQRWPEVDRVYLRNLLLDGAARVNSADARPRQRLRRGDVVSLILPGGPEHLPRFDPARRDDTPPDAPPTVLYEDNSFLVVEKPAGESAVPDRGGKYLGVVGRLRTRRPGAELRAFRRLDVDASGCMVLAKTSAAIRRLEGDLIAGAYEEQSLALVAGSVTFCERRVEEFLGPDPDRPGRIRTVAAGVRGARPAVTQLSREEVFHGYSLVRARPLTLRNHQLRVHLAHIGHPIVADRVYGVRPQLFLSDIKKNYKGRRGVAERPLLSRMFLHVERVRLRSGTGDVTDVIAPLPRDLAVVLQKLRRFADSHRN